MLLWAGGSGGNEAKSISRWFWKWAYNYELVVLGGNEPTILPPVVCLPEVKCSNSGLSLFPHESLTVYLLQFGPEVISVSIFTNIGHLADWCMAFCAVVCYKIVSSDYSALKWSHFSWNRGNKLYTLMNV